MCVCVCVVCMPVRVCVCVRVVRRNGNSSKVLYTVNYLRGNEKVK